MPEMVALAEIAHQRGLVGGPFGSSLVGNDYVAHGVPVIRGNNMSNGRYVSGEFAYVTQAKFDRDLVRSSARPGDVVFTQRGTLGQVALAPREGPELYVVSQSQMRLRVDAAKADSRFIYYACRTPDFLKQISDHAISTGVPHINLGILSKLVVPRMPLAKQVAIAEVLGALDDKIAANAALVATAENLMRSIAMTAPAETGVADVARQSSVQIKPHAFDREVAHFSLPAFDTGARPDMGGSSAIKSNKLNITRPAVLVSKLNPRIPRLWNVNVLPDRMALASTEFVVLDSVSVGPSELWSALAQPEVWTTLEGKVAGTSGSHQRVKPTDIMSLRIKDPRTLPMHLRDSLESLGLRCHSARQESAHLAETRDVLLPLLMSGKIRVKDAETVVEGGV